MSRYEEYKDSCTTWMGQVPSHWKLERAKWHFTSRNERGNDTPVLLAATQKYGMYPQDMVEGVVKVAEGTDVQQFRTVHKGDFVISLRSFQGGFERSDYEGVCSPAYQVFYADDSWNNDYLKYLFKNELFIDAMNALTVGIREGRNIKYEDFANSVLAIPPLAEQANIAKYLDRETERIDAIIAEAKASIEEYKEWKATIIYEAVTKGLDPNVEMKDSGFDYIGDIPSSWMTKKLRNIGTTQNGISKGAEFFGEGYPFVSYGDVYKNYSLPDIPSGLVISTDDERSHYSVEEGDIFFTRTSETIDEIGFSCVCEKTIPDATFAGFLIRVRPYTDDLLTDFAKYYFRSIHHRAFFVKEMNLVTRASLSQGLLKSMPVLVPPKNEQKKIAEYLDEKCSVVNGLIQEKLGLITDLEAYKKSLIFEVVTGKRRVME